MAKRINYSGLVIAGIGFFLTRFTVTLALYNDPFRFYLAGVIPLALGLGLAAFGVALAVADIEVSLVRTTALWCITGTVVMLLFVVLALLGSSSSGSVKFTSTLSQSNLSNFLIGGSIGGTLTGLYASRNRRQREDLRRYANRLVVLNRMLRHEVLNSITAIQGYASLDKSDNPSVDEVIARRSKEIERTINEVKYLTRQFGEKEAKAAPISLKAALEASISEIENKYPDVNVSQGSISNNIDVAADQQLSKVFAHLLENAIIHGNDTTPLIDCKLERNSVRVIVSDTGPGLPESQRRLLETGEIKEFDDPTTGFGLNLVRLFVEEYGGEIETDANESGTKVSIILNQADQDTESIGANIWNLREGRPAIPHLIVTVAAALIAGVSYGIASIALGSSVAGIGVFYGAADPVVGWITHEFHSVVFGFVFAGLVSLASDRWRTGIRTFLGIGIGWALILWAGAAGVIAPIWLQLLGFPVPIPNLSSVLLVSHLAWGITLGLLCFIGYSYVSPILDEWIAEFAQYEV